MNEVVDSDFGGVVFVDEFGEYSCVEGLGLKISFISIYL